MMPSAVPGFEFEVQVAQKLRLVFAEDDGEALHLEVAAWRRQRSLVGLRRCLCQQFPQGVPAAHCALADAPLGDALLDGGQSPSEHDRRGNHHTRGQFLAEHQPGAQGEHQRLQEEAQRLGGGGIDRGAVERGDLQAECALAKLVPAPYRGAHHAEALDCLCVLPQGFRQGIGLVRRLL